MKKTGILLLLFATPISHIAQENWGKIIFQNRNIPKADGTGTYDVPLRNYNTGAGLGSAPEGATLALFLPRRTVTDYAVRLATSAMGKSSTTSPYAVLPSSQIVSVPGYPPGSRAVLMVSAWTGSGTFTGSEPHGEWIFTTVPLGGIPPGGGPEIPTPSLTGWGPEDGSGIAVVPWPPQAFAGGLADGAVFAAPATIQIIARYGGDPGCTATNFAVYAGPTLIANLVGAEIPYPGMFRTFTTPPLGAGKYALYSVAHAGYGSSSQFLFTGATQSIPINVTVVEPTDISLALPTVANGNLTFQYTVNAGLSYGIQSSTNFTDWRTTTTNKPTSSPATYTERLANNPGTYYRVQRLPNP